MSIQIEIDHVNEKNRSVQQLPTQEEPNFSSYEPDLERIRQKAGEYEFSNLVVIGNGGSITSFRAYLYAFLDETDVDVRLVNSMDPDYLNRLSRELPAEDTLVMPISKSGKTTGVIEALLYFVKKGYDAFGVTTENGEALNQILERRGFEFINHPPIGGRFTGLTETALVPAAFAGIEATEIRKGGEEIYGKLTPENHYNPALNIASALLDADQKGYTEIFSPFYSTRLFGFYPLWVQLMHETVCKQGKGQTVYGDLGPECQHHTNQRLFGGRRNLLPFFFRCEAHERYDIKVPDDLEDIELRGKSLLELEGSTLEDSLEAEYQGVKDALDEEGIPNMTLTVTDVSHRNIGKLVALMQYIAVYSAWLREVNPFNQPDVENSKQKGFEQRFEG